MIPFLYLAGASVAMILLASNGSGYSESVKVSSQHAYPSRNHMQGMNVDNARTPIIWGNQVKELSASLLSDKTEFHQGEPILIYFQLKNIGKEAQIVSHAGFWANHKLVIEDAMRSELPLTTLGLEARAVFGNVTKRRKSFEVTLAPGEVDEQYGPFDLRDYFQIGDTTKLYVRCLYIHSSTEVWSNELTLHIR